VIRVAQEVPLPCYGFEQKEGNPLCPTCQHRDGCRTSMGKRFGRLPIDRASFHLIPERLADIELSPDEEFRQIYLECYNILFREKFKPDSVYKSPGLREHVIKEAAAINCPVKLFILTVMWGHKIANANRQFFCTMLSGSAAARRVQAYRAEVEGNFGAFNEKTLDEYAGEKVGNETYESVFLDAEVLAGNWISSYKTKRPGVAAGYFFEANEMSMPDLWLALEPTYHKWLLKWLELKDGTLMIRRKRIAVIKLASQLRRRNSTAIAAFKAREKVMPEAIRRVIHNKNFTVAHFQVDSNQIWKDTFTFWSRLGLALQHYWCHEFLRGNRNAAIKQLSSGQVTHSVFDSKPVT
jgi:hypothetical protein